MKTPWPALMRRAAVAFAIPPQAFWRLSLVEWRALTQADDGALTLDRAGLTALARQFPDEDR
ncbi:MAG: phage tail assembly chaperone [Caulobacter sp.]|nr:phage tail assembly chaperone [Caulobacter sp.]